MRITKPILVGLLLISALTGVAIAGYLFSISKPSVNVRIIPREVTEVNIVISPNVFTLGDQYRLYETKLYFNIKNTGEKPVQLHARIENVIVDTVNAGTVKYGELDIPDDVYPYADHLYLFETNATIDSNAEIDTAFRYKKLDGTWSLGYKHLLEPYSGTWGDKLPILDVGQTLEFEINFKIEEKAQYGQWSWNYVIDAWSI